VSYYERKSILKILVDIGKIFEIVILDAYLHVTDQSPALQSSKRRTLA